MIRVPLDIRRTPAALVVLCCACATSGSVVSTSDQPAAAATAPESAADRVAFVHSVQQKYPTAQFIVGFGVGESAEKAEDNARVDAAKTISDEINANVSSVQSESTTGGKTQQTQSVSGELKEQVKTDAGAFIQPVRELTKLMGRSYQAVAVVDRAQLDQKYATDAGRLLEKVTLAWDRALTASAKSDPSGAASALCECNEDEATLDRLDSERKMVARHGAWTPDALEKRHQVEQLRSKMKGSRVSVYQSASEEGADVTDALVKRLGAAGFEAELVKAPKCNSDSGLLVNVALETNCGASMLGQKCDADFTATSQRCGSTDSLFDEHSDKSTGLHATDVDLAKKTAIKKLNAKKFVDMVAGRVLGALEGGCTK